MLKNVLKISADILIFFWGKEVQYNIKDVAADLEYDPGSSHGDSC